jgi:glucose-6-phosphate 1-epimerase
MIMSIRPLQRFEIPGRVQVADGRGGLAKLDLTTDASAAEIYLQGAHVVGFQQQGEPPLLFRSRLSQFAPGKPIRGGVPICFPWFGPRPGDVMHGFARLSEWELLETAAPGAGETTVRFRLPASARPDWPEFRAEFTVTITDRLAMKLAVSNPAAGKPFEFEDCLHTYFALGDVRETAIRGLRGVHFLDRTDSGAEKVEPDDALRLTRETNRLYPGAAGTVEIEDAKNRRVIRIEKRGSASTVVWNPWTTQLMPDFDPAEHRQMVCVESGNVGADRISLPPGQTHALEVVIGSVRG